jgi:acyl-CoA synthetase (AMP-forming)/AMP-acid ligase II
MRSIDYFDRGHDADPDRAALIDADSGARFTFAEVKALTERIAAAMARSGFINQAPVALYAPNSASVMVALLAIWRANGQWVPVNTRNAIDANIGYLDYVRCEWMFYHSPISGISSALTPIKAMIRRLNASLQMSRPLTSSRSLSMPLPIPKTLSACSQLVARPARRRELKSPISAGG